MVVLIGLLAGIGTITFGWMVLETEREIRTFRGLGDAAISVAELPKTLSELMQPDRSMVSPFARGLPDIPTGWSFPQGAKPTGIDGYLLQSRYDGNRKRHLVELLSLSDFSVVYSWSPDADSLLQDASRESKIASYTRWDTRHFRAIHPYLLDNGDLIFKDHYGPLMRVNACGKSVWRQDTVMFSHSTEPDGAGGLWLPANPVKVPDARLPDDSFYDSLAHVSADGKIIDLLPLDKILAENGYNHLVFSVGEIDKDPVHLNDIEPVLADGPYWKKGDLFLSLRRPSTIMLYRPSTNKIIWSKAGPWLTQHDVDLLDDHRISIFSNNSVRFKDGLDFIGNSEVLVYDFATDTTTSPWSKTFKDYDVKSRHEGLSSQVPGGMMFVEEESAGRYLLFTADGTVVAQFVNRADDGLIYRLGWSRYVEKTLGDKVLNKMKDVNCDE